MARQGYGHIVNTASAAGVLPLPFGAPYSTAKHAAVGLSLSLRLEAADLGVKVSAVCPGFVWTRVLENAVMVNLPQELARRTPARTKMVEPSQAALVVLDGVARNRALITFPGYVCWARRVTCLVPRVLDCAAPRQLREIREYRTLTSGP